MPGAGICLPISDPNNQWSYCPSYPAAVGFTAVFAAITLAHIVQAIVYRKWFCWVICMACAWETVGFVFRILGVEDQSNSTWATISQLLILLSPLWVNAFAYMMLGRMAYFWLPEKSIWKFKARTITKWFVCCDILSFLIQATGGSMIDNTDPNTAQLGLHIYMAGIGVQEAFLLIFTVLMVKFHVAVRDHGVTRQTSWQAMLFALYASLILITVRIIFRLVEFSSGLYGPIPEHEIYFYILEAVPMVLAMFILAVIHPGRLLIGSDSEFSKLKVVKGGRRWWCCGRRRRNKIDLDFESVSMEEIPGTQRQRGNRDHRRAHSESGYRLAPETV